MQDWSERHWSERLRWALRRKGWTAAELARRSGVNVDSIYKYLQKDGVDAPRGPTLGKLASALDVNEPWLDYGVGEPDADTGALTLSALRKIPIVNLSALAGLKKLSALPELLGDAVDSAVMPPAIADIGPRAFAVTIDDDSGGRKFPRGTMVICDPDAPVGPGNYVIAISAVANQPVFRRFKGTSPRGQKGFLVAENDDFPKLPMRSAKDGFIVGRALLTFAYQKI